MNNQTNCHIALEKMKKYGAVSYLFSCMLGGPNQTLFLYFDFK